jgi:CheY-like chemotaxis protein
MAYLLYAEDDFDDQQDFKDLMRDISPDIRVVLVHTGLAMLQYLDTLGPHEEWPFMLVLDMNMPVWDGIKTLQALKNAPRYEHIPVIFYSTSTEPSDADLALQNGATDFLRKPSRRDQIPAVTAQWALHCHRFLKPRSSLPK